MKNQVNLNAKDGITINGQKVPDPKLHQKISFIKSAVRIFGYGALLISLEVGVILLILSELIGIYEELV